jgi:hypothetical protein
VENALQQELTARFPPDRFPIELNLVGPSTGGSTLVAVAVPGADHEESRFVVFPHLRVNKVVFLNAVTELLASFEKASSTNLGHIK